VETLIYTIALFATSLVNAHAAGFKPCANPYSESLIADPRLGPVHATCLDDGLHAGKYVGIYFSEVRNEPKIYWIQASVIPGRITSIDTFQTLTDPALFPEFCGGGLAGARVLPGSSKIALLYQRDLIRIVALQNQQIHSTIDPHGPGASICVGVFPDASFRRTDESVVIDAARRALTYTYSIWVNRTRSDITETVSY